MTTNLQPLQEAGKIAMTDDTGHRIKGFRYYMAKLRANVTKYVTIDKDGIFKDPDWPHLWNHKR